MDELGAEGLGEAFPLQGLLLRVHGEGDVDGDDEGEVDLRLGRGLGQGRRDGQRPQTGQPAARRVKPERTIAVSLLGSRIGSGKCASF